MTDAALSAGRLLVALFLVALNGFFVASEFALVRIRSTQVDALVAEGRPGAELVEDVVANLDDYLAVTQLGITIASLGLGWAGEPAIAALIEPVLASVLPAGVIHLVAVALGFGVITFLHVVFGELAPKTIAIQRAERIALLVAAPMKAFYYLFLPGIVVFNGVANHSTRLLGIDPASETDEPLSEEEILLTVSRAGEHGRVGGDEVEMIEAVFDFDDTIAREVMVPRPDVVTVSAGTPLPELRSLAVEAGHTRYPVLGPDDEEIVGILDVKDLLRASERAADGDDRPVTAADLARETVVVPETREIDELLTEFQDRQRQMAAVIDEWGAFEGVVTIEDVVEQLVGDLRDRFDTDAREPSITRLEDGAYAVDGGVGVDRVNDELEVAFESGSFDTIGGLVLRHLGRAPEVGDATTLDGYTLRVAAVDGSRVSEVVVEEGGSESSRTDEESAD